MNITDNKTPEDEQDIDFIALTKYLWSKRKLFLKC